MLAKVSTSTQKYCRTHEQKVEQQGKKEMIEEKMKPCMGEWVRRQCRRRSFSQEFCGAEKQGQMESKGENCEH